MDFNASTDTLIFRQFGNESQVTLVDTSTNGAPHTFVSFLRDSMTNTKILSSDERLLYTVDSDKNSLSTTTVYREDSQEALARISRKDLRADKIKFAGMERSVKLSSWLSGASGKWSDFPVSFTWTSERYTWRTKGRQIALYREDDLLTPIAWFQTSRKDIIEGTPAVVRALIALQPEALDILDGLVISLIVVERALRLKDDRFKRTDGGLPTLPC